MVYYTRLSLIDSVILDQNYGPSIDAFYIDESSRKTHAKFQLIDTPYVKSKYLDKFVYGPGRYSDFYISHSPQLLSTTKGKKVDNVIIDEKDEFFAIFNIVKDNINGVPSNKLSIEKYQNSVIVDEKVKVCRIEDNLYILNYV